MSERIPHSGIQELTDALIEAPSLTPEEIQKAMALAYDAGRIDGSLATANNLLATSGGETICRAISAAKATGA